MRIAFDIDDTLWKIRIWKSNGKVVGDQVPDFDLIQVLRWFATNGDDVFVWSAGGILYAQQIVDKLGLSELVTVIPKEQNPRYDVDLAFDDERVTLGRVNCQVKRPNHQKVYESLLADDQKDRSTHS